MHVPSLIPSSRRMIIADWAIEIAAAGYAQAKVIAAALKGRFHRLQIRGQFLNIGQIEGINPFIHVLANF